MSIWVDIMIFIMRKLYLSIAFIMNYYVIVSAVLLTSLLSSKLRHIFARSASSYIF